jgi:hypothetical protein
MKMLDYPSEQLRIITVEGDSEDDTLATLMNWRKVDKRVHVVRCNTGKPHYGSVVSPERFAVLAEVFNTALDEVDLEWSDYVLFTPSDVRFKADTLSKLLAHKKDMVAPFFWGKDERFHDTWGFATLNGRSFTKFSVFEVDNFSNGDLMEMSTVGGMVLIDSKVLKAGCRYTPEEVDRGLCKMARAKGFSVWADPRTYIEHL